MPSLRRAMAGYAQGRRSLPSRREAVPTRLHEERIDSMIQFRDGKFSDPPDPVLMEFDKAVLRDEDNGDRAKETDMNELGFHALGSGGFSSQGMSLAIYERPEEGDWYVEPYAQSGF